MNEKNIKKNLDCIIQSYETIKIILQPNLNENKKNFLNNLFEILNFEINIIKQILFEINNNNLNVYINKNIEIISKYIAKLLCFIKENKKKFNSQLIKTFPISFQIIQNTNVNLNQNNFNIQTNIEKNLFSKKFTLPKNKNSNSNLHRFYSPNIELRNNVSTSSLNSYNNINNYNYKNQNKNNNNNNNINNYNTNLNFNKKKFNLTNYNSANNSNYHSSNHSTNNLNINNVKSKKDVYKNLENLGFNVSIESLKPSIYTKYLVKKYIDVVDNNDKIDLNTKHFKKLNINNNNIKKIYSKNNNYNNSLNNYNNFTTQNSLINNNSFLITSPNKNNNNNLNIFNKNKMKFNNKKISVKKNF